MEDSFRDIRGKFRRYVFAGDRDISAYVLEDLLEAGHSPCLVIVADHGGETHPVY